MNCVYFLGRPDNKFARRGWGRLAQRAIYCKNVHQLNANKHQICGLWVDWVKVEVSKLQKH